MPYAERVHTATCTIPTPQQLNGEQYDPIVWCDIECPIFLEELINHIIDSGVDVENFGDAGRIRAFAVAHPHLFGFDLESDTFWRKGKSTAIWTPACSS